MTLVRLVPKFTVVLLILGSSACDMIPVKVNTSSTIRKPDGTVEHHETHWSGTIDQLPAQISKAGDELSLATDRLIKELTEVPPPGKVTLSDLGLQQYAGNSNCDFLRVAKDDDGRPISFQYVQLGVPSYDKFFKDAQTLYAILYQADQVVHRMAQLSSTILGHNVDVNAQLNVSVSQALGATGSLDSQVLVGELKQMKELAASLAPLASQFVSRVAQLVSDGEQLIAGARASLTNPKVVLHLDSVVEGLGASVKVIKTSAGLLGNLGGELTSFLS